MADEIRISITKDADIVVARLNGRALAKEMGFSLVDLTLIATAISELARNIVEYAKHGEILLNMEERAGRRALVLVARDEGPGIPDIGLAMQDGYSTTNSLGLGLPGVRRLMDEFEIVSAIEKGTTVTAKKWTR